MAQEEACAIEAEGGLGWHFSYGELVMSQAEACAIEAEGGLGWHFSYGILVMAQEEACAIEAEGGLRVLGANTIYLSAGARWIDGTI